MTIEEALVKLAWIEKCLAKAEKFEDYRQAVNCARAYIIA